MPVDTSLYRMQQPVQVASPLDSQRKAMSLSQLALQNQAGAQRLGSMQRDDARKAHLQKAQVFGQELDALQTLPDEQKPEAYARMRQNLVQNGVIKPDDLPEQMDPGLNNQLLSRYYQSQPYLEKELTRAKIAGVQEKRRSDMNKRKLSDLSPGEKKADQEFAKDAAEYYYGGGKATVEKNLGKLESAVQKLEQDGELGGGLSAYLPDVVDDAVNPERAAVRDDIRSAIQASLKQILGAQFTEKEGQAIFERAFNPRLSDAENARRVRAELNAIKRMADQKDKALAYFRDNRTLRGFKPDTSLMTAQTQAEPSRTREGGGGMVEPAAYADSGDKVRVSNGSETYMIDMSDLPDAMEDGFEVLR